MEKYSSLSAFTLGILLIVNGCGKNEDNAAGCDNPITVNEPFTARVGETWCIPSESWKITFGPYIEDSRCNVVNIECVWAGRFVLAATLNNGGSVTRDTFFAVHDWRDTMHTGSHQVILNKVFPEIRQNTDPLDQGAYSFEMVVK